MMILRSIRKWVPYAGPIFSALGLAVDVMEIIEVNTPAGATKVIVARLVNECTPPNY